MDDLLTASVRCLSWFSEEKRFAAGYSDGQVWLAHKDNYSTTQEIRIVAHEVCCIDYRLLFQQAITHSLSCIQRIQGEIVIHDSVFNCPSLVLSVKIQNTEAVLSDRARVILFMTHTKIGKTTLLYINWNEM